MKLLYSTTWRPEPSDGVSTTSSLLVPELRSRGIRVVVTSTDCGLGPSAYARIRSDDFHVFTRTFSKPLEISVPMIRHLAALVSEVDVCHFNGFYSVASVVGGMLARRRGKPYVIGPAGNCVPTLRECLARPMELGKRVFFHALAKSGLQHADAVVCTSECERGRVLGVAKSARTVVVPNGVNLESHGPGVTSPFAVPYVLFLGRISREKSLPFLLEVWAEVRERNPEALLVIAGNDDFCPGYAKLVIDRAARLSLRDSVRFVGTVTGEAKLSLLAGSACLVLPSIRESFGNVVTEALSVGTPAVTSTGTPWRTMAEAGLGEWLPLDKRAWAAAIHGHLQQSGAARDALAFKCRSWIESNLLSWHQCAEMHERVYRAAIDGRAPDRGITG